jgi:phage protein D
MERRTRAFEDVSDADVVRRVASQHGLTADVDLDGPTYRVLTQVNQSDLAFLRERVAAIDADLWVDGRTLHAQMRARRDAGRVDLAYGVNLREFSVLADLAHQRSSVHVCGWDVAAKQAIDVEAGEGAIAGELSGRRSGSAVLAQALAERHERIATAVPHTQPEARALADARYRTRARRFLRGTGITDGEPAIRAGTRVELAGVGALFDGGYVVTCVRHTFDLRHAYRTTFEVERPGIGG